MYPTASICGLFFANTKAKYFATGKISRDQVVDYHNRKGMNFQETYTVAEIEAGIRIKKKIFTIHANTNKEVKVGVKILF